MSKTLTAWLLGLGALALIVLIGAQAEHAPHFPRDGITIDSWPGFFELFGLAAGLGLVLVAKTLAVALKRKDTFYADD